MPELIKTECLLGFWHFAYSYLKTLLIENQWKNAVFIKKANN